MKNMNLKQIEEQAKEFSVNQLLKQKGYRNKPLNFNEAYMLGIFSLSPFIPSLKRLFPITEEKTHIQSVAALSTFHNKALYSDPESAKQIAGICSAVFDYDIGESSSGIIQPKVDSVFDNCGMGGDLIKTPNLSTIAGLIASSAWR